MEKDELSNGGETIGTSDNPPEPLIGTGDIAGEGLYYADYRITIQAIPEEDSYLLGIFDIPDDNLITLGGSEGKYTFMMPTQDVQYLTKFRPNPYIIMRQRFIDEFGNETVGGLTQRVRLDYGNLKFMKMMVIMK